MVDFECPLLDVTVHYQDDKNSRSLKTNLAIANDGICLLSTLFMVIVATVQRLWDFRRIENPQKFAPHIERPTT